MTLVIIGGTGRIGGPLVRAALARGEHVVVAARHPEELAVTHDNLTRATLDVLEPETLAGPLAGARAVVFAAGKPGRGPTIVRSAGIAAVGRAMREAGVSRLVTVAPSAAAISRHTPLSRKIALRYFVHKVYRNPFLDVERMEDELPHTGLDWSVVRAPRLLDGPASGRYSVVPEERVGRVRPVPLADFADFVVGHALDTAACHDVLTVTGGVAAGALPVPVGSPAGQGG